MIHLLSQLLQYLWKSAPKQTPKRPEHRIRLQVEALECRSVPSATPGLVGGPSSLPADWNQPALAFRSNTLFQEQSPPVYQSGYEQFCTAPNLAGRSFTFCVFSFKITQQKADGTFAGEMWFGDSPQDKFSIKGQVAWTPGMNSCSIYFQAGLYKPTWIFQGTVSPGSSHKWASHDLMIQGDLTHGYHPYGSYYGTYSNLYGTEY